MRKTKKQKSFEWKHLMNFMQPHCIKLINWPINGKRFKIGRFRKYLIQVKIDHRNPFFRGGTTMKGHVYWDSKRNKFRILRPY